MSVNEHVHIMCILECLGLLAWYEFYVCTCECVYILPVSACLYVHMSKRYACVCMCLCVCACVCVVYVCLCVDVCLSIVHVTRVQKTQKRTCIVVQCKYHKETTKKKNEVPLFSVGSCSS